MSQTLVSHHLAPLRRQNIVTVTPHGRSNIYALCCDALATPVRLLAALAATDVVMGRPVPRPEPQD
jgi:DNA-binding transcriptional ArsR family regulator